MEFIKRANWKNLLIMVICGVGFVSVFNDIIDNSKKTKLPEATYFMIEITADDLSEGQKSEAIEKTLAVYKNRKDEIKIPGTQVMRQGKQKVIIYIPKSIDTEEAARIKKILISQDRILYKLTVYGPMNQTDVKQ